MFPISMSRIDNSQSPQEYENYLKYFTSKVQTPKIGIHFFYTEGLYMNFEEKAFETKNVFIQKMVNHKNGVKKIIKKNFLEFQIEKAFTFQSWFQMCLSSDDFLSVLKQAKDFYDTDERFQKLIRKDAELAGRELDEKQLQFFLEEFTFAYLAVYGKFEITNQHVEGKEEWELLAYPGKPFLSQIHFVQKNIMNFKKKEKSYIGHYDLSQKRYYDFLKIDTDNFVM
ncbi:MAG: Uncharacterized protein Greene07144_926 [Parcubacteria group bacterium Greene0714_4]|nr:MAG: Uncharacterized protein Greene07144_926 [Parcubacteria group bacterium Greene0714_4]